MSRVNAFIEWVRKNMHFAVNISMIQDRFFSVYLGILMEVKVMSKGQSIEKGKILL